MNYVYIVGTILFTVYGQIIIKWRILGLDWSIPQDTKLKDTILSYLTLLFDPFIFSGFLSAFIASVFWIMAMTKFELTYAYPFMSLSPALVFLIGILFLNETFTLGKIVGLIFIIIGIIITVKL